MNKRKTTTYFIMARQPNNGSIGSVDPDPYLDPDTESKRVLTARQKECKQVISCFQELMFFLLKASKLPKLENPSER